VTQDELRALFDYHYWARDRILAAAERITPEQYARDMGNSFRSVRATLCHIYLADLVWYRRWQGLPPPATVSAEPYETVADLRQAWLELEGQYRAYLDSLGDEGVQRILSYTLLSGAAGTSIIWQMMQHVVNHATYHRGQVTTMLRQLGADPPKSLDLIAFYRERQTAVAGR